MSSKNPLYEVTTEIEREDFKRFQYLSTFFRRKVFTFGGILVLAAVVAGFLIFAYNMVTVIDFMFTWIILSITAGGGICILIEWRCLKKVRSGVARPYGPVQYLTFYENYFTATTDTMKGSNKIKYDTLFAILESKDYYLLYTNKDRASVMRKKDIEPDIKEELHKFLYEKLGKRMRKI